MGSFEFLADLEGHVLHHPSVLVAQCGKPRIDTVVKNVALQQPDDLRGSMNAYGLFQFAKQIVDKDWQARDVIHMRMRDDHVANRVALIFAESDADASGIDADAVIDQKASQTLRRAGTPVGIER